MATINFLYRSTRDKANLQLRLLYSFNDKNYVFGANTKFETTKEYKKNDRDPDYGGTFTLPGDIILKANTKYIFGGWILTDGSINSSFTPLANLQKNIVTQENLKK